MNAAARTPEAADTQKELYDLLSLYCENHRRLLSLSKRKTEVLLRGDVDALGEVMNTEMPLLMELGNLESRWEDIRRRTGAQADFQNCDGAARAGLEDFSLHHLTDSLSRMARELQKINNVNKAILETRLSTIRYMGSMLGVDQGALTYQKP